MSGMTNDGRSARDVLADALGAIPASIRGVAEPGELAAMVRTALADAGFRVVRDGEVVLDGERWEVEPTFGSPGAGAGGAFIRRTLPTRREDPR